MTARPDLHDRFRRVVARAIVKADAEIAAHHARIRGLPVEPGRGRARIDELLRPRSRRQR